MTLWDIIWIVRRAFRKELGLPYGELTRREEKKKWEAQQR